MDSCPGVSRKHPKPLAPTFSPISSTLIPESGEEVKCDIDMLFRDELSLVFYSLYPTSYRSLLIVIYCKSNFSDEGEAVSIFTKTLSIREGQRCGCQCRVTQFFHQAVRGILCSNCTFLFTKEC